MQRYHTDSRRKLRLQWFSISMILLMLLPMIWPVASSASPLNQAAKGDVMIDPPIAQPPGANGTTSGLHLTLSEGAEQPTTSITLPVAAAQPLSSADTAQLLSRLPSLSVPVSDTQGFRLPPAPLPAPRPGQTIAESFPPTQTLAATPTVAGGPLQVLRFAPQGELRVAPFLNVTFNQPMVPLATLVDLRAQDVPVKITPEVPGVWKWLGTRTLSFEYKSDDLDIDRFPKATTYTVEIPAGTKSATGGVLAEAVKWTFTTPPPRLVTTYPSAGPQSTGPLLFVSFDQGIEAEAVLKSISVTAGGQTYPVRLATQEELAANAAVQNLIKSAREGRWLAFHAEQAFPTDTTVVVNIGPGTPSAEGPLTTTAVQSYSFTTYAPLRITESGCAYGGNQCPPLSPFFIRFNNAIDPAKFDPALIQVEPAIANVRVMLFGDSVQIEGSTQGRTTYKITVDGTLTDLFGQQLGKSQTVTVTTGSAERFLSGPSNNFVTLDPTAKQPVLNIYTINYEKVRVRVFAVTADNWPAYLQWFNQNAYQDNATDPPGNLVINQTLPIKAQPDQLTESSIDLTEALPAKTGHVIVVVDVPPGLIASLLGNQDRNRVIAWVQATQIGLDALVDRGQLVAWATNLKDGAPLADVHLSLVSSQLSATTGKDGLARFELPTQASQVLLGKLGDDTAILPANNYYWDPNSGWMQQQIIDEVRWYVFDDRQMYRPGEEVHLKGWLRRIEGKATGDVTLVGSGLENVQYQITDPQGNQIGNGVADVNDLGGFDFAFKIPENANLGSAQIYLSARNVGNASGADNYHTIQIQEFRRPEFEVTARSEDKGPFFVGDQAVVAVNAKYFAGGALPNADTNWTVSVSPGSYAPPNWPDFTFGKWIPWWMGVPDYGLRPPTPGGGGGQLSYQGKTDASGTHYLRMSFDSIDEPQPYSILADASVMDVNRQTWAATTSLLVHPADLYVGIRSDRYFVQQDDPLKIDTIVTDLDGNAVAGVAVNVHAARLDWKFVKGQWQQEAVDGQDCQLTSTKEPLTCTFATKQGGSYQITATIKDDKGRANRSEFMRWVSGGKQPPAREVQQEQVTLIPNQQNYQPGDTAEILVQSPFGPAEGLVTIQRGDILSTERIQLRDGTYTLKVPIKEEYIPSLTIQVDLNGSAQRSNDKGQPLKDAPPRPAFATGRLDLTIPPLSRELKLAVAPAAKALAPGASTAISVTVNDASGQPVQNAELAVVIVDEAILALTNYQMADPLAAFYSQRYSNVSGYYGRSNIVLANPEQLAQGVANAAADSFSARAAGVGGGAAPAPTGAPAVMAMAAPAAEAKSADGAQQAAAPIAVRSDFNPLATFAPAVRTDAQGQAQIEVKLPDNLTRYRVMVVAVADGKHFGMGESSITARLPLMVRPSAPRFLNFGDRFELPVVLQNQTDVSMTVNVGVQVSNLQLLSEEVMSETVANTSLSTGKVVVVPANDRVEVRFPATTVSAGTARAQIAATAGDVADAASIELPVYTPATSEAFAVYGVVDEGSVAQPVLAPTGVFTQFGGLEISTSSTALQALSDAVLYLVAYPYECSEQLASRILAVASLRDVLTAFQAPGLPAPAEMEKAVQRDIARLQGMQNDDGGFPVWERGRESVPYYSIHVAHALQRAKLKGFEVPADMQQRALDHLRNIENYYPSWYSEATRQALSAYALYVRKLMGDVDTAKARTLLNAKPLEDQPLETVAWLWQVLSDDAASAQEVAAIRQLINNRAVETAGAANFTTSYGEQDYLLLHSNRRTDGIILDALINDQPDSDLIPKVVNGLLAHRTAGHWDNTQENAFILLALDRYFNTFEAQTPDFVARVWLGDSYVAEHQYAGRTTERHETDVPMDYLVSNNESAVASPQSLIISKEGTGRLYYRLGLRYAPTDLNLKPLEMGFVVQRSYEAVDHPGDVTRDQAGVWHIKAGARVRVRVTMVADNRRYNVALVDPLPAGLEILNPALAVAESIPQDPNDKNSYGWWWWGSWFEHQNFRDSRAEAFTSLLWDGVYNYSYVARATTPGHYIVPPAKAEEMYSPEVFGRSASDQVVVE